jgi:hypothetical protein
VDGRPRRQLCGPRGVIELHLAEGGELGGAFVEMRATFLALAGDHLAAVRLYSAARAAHTPSDYEKAWRAGADLTLAEITAG